MSLVLRFLPWSMLLAIPLLAGDGFSQCSKDALGSCYESNGSPGCLTTECCDEVCAYDGYCCETVWDEACVTYAEELCEGLACPGAQPCDATSEIPGCSDPGCCRLVCDHDWFCCFVEWDEQCIEMQRVLCGVDPCEITIPDGTPVEEEPCYTRVNDGCNRFDRPFDRLDCGMSVTGTTTTDAPRDTDWYRIELTGPTLVRWTVTSEFPAQVVLVSGTCDGPTEALEVLESAHCGTITVERMLDPGDHALVIAPGTAFAPVHGGIACDLEDPKDPPDEDDPPVEPSHFGLRYLVEATCETFGIPGDLDGNGRVDGADLLLVLASWGSDDAHADLDGDGVVGGSDILIVLGAWSA